MVWTAENRGRYDRRGQRYPSDLTNEEWAALQPLLPVRQGRGRPRAHRLREVMNGIRYVVRHAQGPAAVEHLPRLLAPAVRRGPQEQINHRLVMMDREKAGREASPTLAIIDAQSVKCDAPQGERG